MPILPVDELFKLYPRLAARVTDLRSILQNPELITRENCDAWAEDVKSVTNDLMVLTTHTAQYLRSQLKEPSHDQDSIPPID